MLPGCAWQSAQELSVPLDVTQPVGLQLSLVEPRPSGSGSYTDVIAECRVVTRGGGRADFKPNLTR